MKKGIVLSLFLALSYVSFAQVVQVTEGSIDFLAKATLVDVAFDWSEAKVNGLDGMQAYIDYRYEEVELEDNKKEADKWKTGWKETIDQAEEEFVITINDEIKKTPLKFVSRGKSGKYKATMKIKDFTSGKINFMGASADNFATFDGDLIFTDSKGATVAVVAFTGWKGNPSTSVYTMGEGFRVNSLFKKAGTKLGLKIYNSYFKKKK